MLCVLTAISYTWGMTAEHFDKTLQAYQKRRLFRSFSVRFVSGEQIDVDHPEALVIRAGVALFISAEVSQRYSIVRASAK